MREDKVTFCRVCEALCGLVATVEDGRVVALRPDPDHVVSKGYACAKGLAFAEVTHDPDRVTEPRKRVDGRWRPVDWDTAIGEIAGRLDAIRRRDGGDAIAFYTGNPSIFSYSTRLSAGALAAAVGTRNVYSALSQDNGADFLASKFLYGAYLLQPIPDLDRTDHLLLVGVNPIVSHGTLVHAADIGRRLKAVRSRGGKVVVIDPRRTQTARIASEHHFVRPDSDVFLLMAMLHVILAEGLESRGFLEAHASGVDELRRVVALFPPQLAAARTGVDADTVRRLARELAAAPRACVYGRAVCGTFGTLTAWACDVLNVVTGNLDVPGGAIFADGLLDMVAVTEKVGIHEYGARRSRLSGMPACRGDLPSGVLVEEILTPGRGQIRALVVTAGNPVLSIPRGDELARAMRGLECSVAIDFYLNETAACADYFLPATTFLEREDLPLAHQNLMLEPFVQWTDPVIAPVGQARPEWRILSDLGRAMGLPFMNDPVLDRLDRLGRLFRRPLAAATVADLAVRTGPLGDKLLPWRKGLRLARIREQPHGLLLPPNRTGDLRRRIRHADGRVGLWNEYLEGDLGRLLARVRGDAAAGEPTAAAARRPLQLIGRRDPRSHNTWMHNVARLSASNACDLRMHPDDARDRGIAAGARVRVRSEVGAVEANAVLTDELMPGVVCMPHGWGHDGAAGRTLARNPGVNCNLLVDHRRMEPLSGMSFLNGLAVEVEAVDGEKNRR